MRFRLIAASAVVAALAAPGIASAHARLVRTIPADGAVVAKAPANVRIESGVVAFAVGKDAKTPTAALEAAGTGPLAADVVARWLLYAGLLGAVGTALFALVARPQDEERVALIVSSLAVVAAVGAGDEAHRVGLHSRAGAALGAAALTAVVVGTLAGAATLDRRLLRPALLLAPLLVVPTAFAGHAYDPGVNRLNVAADALHVAGASAWIGALVGLVAFRDGRRSRAVALALGGVVVLSLTGVIRAWSELLRVAQLWDTSYGHALLVKTGVLLAALVAGWFLRARIRRRAGVELVLAAGLVVAVSVLVLLEPGRNFASIARVRVSTAEPSPPPPLPPRGAVVVAKELGALGVALELEPGSMTAIVLSPAGGGLDGLDVRLNGVDASPCGHGCYRTEKAPGTSVAVQVDRFGPTLHTTFDVPQNTRPGDALLRRVEDRYRTLRSVFYLERLASSPAHALTALWRLESPNRLQYQIPGGTEGIVIGNRRWDRNAPDAAWQESAQTQLPQPATLWSSIANVHVVAADADTRTLTFVDPVTPAFFEVVIDVHTLLPRLVSMTAAAHFMVDRYIRFNAPRVIRPPR